MPDPSGAAIKAACTHWLSQHVPVPVGERLRGLASSPHAALEPDVYGKGGAVAVLEARTAELLGKPAAVFVAKGMTAQLCSLRAHIEARGTTDVAIHPQSHLDVDEAGAIERVGGAAAIRLGRYRPFGVAELQAVTDRLAAVVIELPLRRSGYLLPPLGELKAISAHCRDHRIPLHFDGARLWEAAAAYGVPLADLAALADSVYVSFYKGLGGLGGAMLLGSEAHIAALAPWKTRYGGSHFTSYPQAISALEGLDRHLPRMDHYAARARSLAQTLDGTIAARVHPLPPQGNAFQLLLKGSPAQLAESNLAFASQHKVWLFNAFVEAPTDGQSVGEVVIGNAADHFDDDAAWNWLAEFSQSA